MKHLTNYLCFLLITLFLGFQSCNLLEPDDNDSNDPNKDIAELLDIDDFSSDLVLEDRNDGVDYIIESEIGVSNSLEIKPGVVIEFEEAGALRIRETGSINAIGLPGEEIKFTGVIKAKGSWKGIFLDSESLRNQFKHCIIEFAGKDNWGNGIQGGLTTWADAAFNVDNTTFRSNKSAGMETYPHNVEIRSFENNRFENNDKSIVIAPGSIHQLGNTNEFADLLNVIELQNRTVFENNQSGESYTWKAHSAPYRILFETQISNNNLIIEEGATLEFSENGYFNIRTETASLTAIGTALKPITFTGIDKFPGAWAGLAYNFTSSSKNKLEFCQIEYAGGTANNFDKGAIYMWDVPTLSVKQCNFKEIASCVYNSVPTAIINTNLTETNNSYQNTGSVFCE